MRFLSLLFIFAAGFLLALTAYGSVLPWAADAIIQPESITLGTPTGGDVFDTSRDFGLRILTAVKVLVSGFWLIWMVMIGAYMVVFSENEERIKSEKRQFFYVFVAFLFLNIPGLIYTVFFWDVLGSSRSMGAVGDGSSVDFWDSTTLFGINGFVPQIIGFFEVFIFGIAILTMTWWAFRMIVSGGNEEVQKKAKNRLLNGFLGLIFLGFVKFWGSIIAKGDFFGEFATVGQKFLWLALYFAPPVVIGFLVLAAFYMITSGGDEERVKKAKSIFTNTLIASVILLWAYSFISDLATFTL